MTISKGAPWGSTVNRPEGLRIAVDDADLARLLIDGTSLPTAVAAGDMWRTVGAASMSGRDRLNELPLDLIDVGIDDSETVAVSHVVARLPHHRGGWWRGPVIAVMNAEFFGLSEVAPRGHPNDGRLESFVADRSMSFRQRIAVRRRLRNASHLPHPQITTRSTTAAEFVDLPDLRVLVDGRDRGSARRLSVRVRPDAAVLYA